MRFSIVIPIYKAEKYLVECVESILGQTFTDFELILVDDGSPDSCPNICDRYASADSRIKVIHQKNAGQAAARNAGVNISRGDYLMFLDSDDYYATNDVLLRVNKKTESSHADVILFGYKKLYESDASFGSEVAGFPDFSEKSFPSNVIMSLLQNDIYDGCAWTKAVKRSLIVDNAISFRPGMISEDSDWYLNVMSHATSYDCIKEVFVIYRQHANSVSHKVKLNALADNLWIQEAWKIKIAEIQMSEELRLSLFSVLAMYYANLLVLYSLYPKSQSEPYFKRTSECRDILRYSITKRSKVLKVFVSIFGLRATILMLRVLNRLIKRH